MSYKFQAKLRADASLQLRVTACAASENILDPDMWAASKMWELSAQPGWVPAYLTAIQNDVEFPGDDESVITDGMILAAVQALKGVVG